MHRENQVIRNPCVPLCFTTNGRHLSCFSCVIYLSYCFDKQKPLDVTNHSVAREVVTFFTLPPGDYVVVPQTGIAHCEGKFLLRIFTDEHSNIWLDIFK